MSARLKNIDRDSPMLLPPDLREWVDDDDLVHFVIEAVDQVPAAQFAINHQGSGSQQYPPRMLLSLLIYCYANGIFSSRRIERATHRDVAVRYLTGNTHPDHDTICAFRRRNFEAVSSAFLCVLQLARELGLLKVGTVSVDGTHLRANASKYKSIRYDRACEIEEALKGEVDELLEKAEAADEDSASDGQSVPEEIARRENLRKKLQKAREKLEKRALTQGLKEQAEYERKMDAYNKRSRGGRKPKPPKQTPEPEDQINLTDEDSRLMKKSSQIESRQCYNGQLAVDADGSMLILSNHVSQRSGDNAELAQAVRSISEEVGKPEAVLADSGYVNLKQFKELSDRGVELYIPPELVGKQRHRHDFRPAPKKRRKKKRAQQLRDSTLIAMREKLNTDRGRAVYRKRKETVEPVFGVIKHCMGFRQFMLRGREKVAGEWNLVCLAYNMKRLARLRTA